jgi:ribosomal protein S18 acetylase RimI-like enzyme
MTSDYIEFRQTLDGLAPDDLDGFFEGWPNPPDAATHLRILESAYAVQLAIDTRSDRVVGFVNAISDGVLSAYVPLLEVLPEWRGQGIGRALVQRLCEQLSHLYMVDLVCDPELEAFYEPLGFHKMLGMGKRNYDNQSGASQTKSASGKNPARSSY